MKNLTLYILTICFSIGLNAQIDNESVKTIDFSGLSNNKKVDKFDENDIKKEITLPKTPNFTSPKSFTGLNYKTKIDIENFGTLNPIKMEFGVAPTVHKHLTSEQPNYLKKEKGISAFFQRDQKLGDLFTKSDFLIIRFRDYGQVDGDIVRLIINDEVRVHRAILGSSYSEIKIDLTKPGFYKIDFMALNMGRFAPNTAQLKIIDDKFEQILNEQWALSTGFKATAVVIKE